MSTSQYANRAAQEEQTWDLGIAQEYSERIAQTAQGLHECVWSSGEVGRLDLLLGQLATETAILRHVVGETSIPICTAFNHEPRVLM